MKLFGLIGNPVAHSLSGKYFNDKFLIEGIDAAYSLFNLQHIDEIDGLLDQHPQLAGFNVTHPFKAKVIPFCSVLDEVASATRSVNTVVVHRDKSGIHLKGYNTDAGGFAAAIMPLIGKRKLKALLLGTGGAARAVAYALSKLGLEFRVVSRKAGRDTITYDMIDPGMLGEHLLIINATPLGMGALQNETPAIPFEALGPGHLLYDLNYNPAETAFLRRGREAGARTANGMMMLQAQAELSWKLWSKA